MTEKEKMVSGELYKPGDPELVAARQTAQRLTAAYNATTYGDDDQRHAILTELLGSLGARCAIRAPFYVDYGENIHLGDDVFFNYGVVVLDCAPVTVGDMTQIGAYSQILAADHPRDHAERDAGLECAKPVTIGRNVWIGSAALILPGITIGDDAIIGAGAVVTRDIPPGMTATGNPARARLRE